MFLGEAPEQVFERADELARSGQWEQAADLFVKGLDAYPVDHWNWYRSGVLQAYLDQLDQHKTHCREMLELFNDTQDPFIAERTGKLCLLLPNGVPKDVRVSQLIDRAVGMRPDVPWFLLAAAMSKHRAGQFEDAIDQLARAEARSEEQFYCSVLIELFRAMSEHQLGEQDSAKASLERAISLLPPTAAELEDEEVDYGPNWHDALTCQVILREAEALIIDKETTPSQPSRPEEDGSEPKSM